MNDRIINYLSQSNTRPIDRMKLAQALDITPQELPLFLAALKELEDQGTIIETKQLQYQLSSTLGLKKGILRLNKKGFGFIDFEDEEDDVYVSKMHLMGAMDQDQVLVQINHVQGQKEATIRKILKRANHQIVGEVYERQGKLYLQPDDSKILSTLQITNQAFKGLMVGHKVVAKIIEYQDHHHILVEVDRIIGHHLDPGVDILSIIEAHGLKTKFEETTLKEAALIKDSVSQKERQSRIDLTHLEVMTMDGKSAKDLDDAIHLTKLNNGHFEVGVHIADVSHYVTANSALDIEAYQRGTSVYLVDRVIPMIPHRLSNGICSLNPQVDRLCISCVFEIDETGTIYDHRLFPSIIRSKYRMTYEDTNLILAGDQKLCEHYQPIVSTIRDLHRVAKGLASQRQQRGAIDFDVKEAKVVVNKKGKAVDIVLDQRGEAEKIIESLMICANELVAEHIFWMELPFIYRVHEPPKVKRLREFIGVASLLGYRFKGQIDHLHPKDIQKIITQSSNKKEASLISTLLLRSMQKARYSSQNIGHYGLASTHYTHFTSPIRRYPDLIVHRLLKTYLFDQELSEQTIDYYRRQMDAIADQTSQSEQMAIACERDVMDMKKAEFMEDKLGQTFNGVISSVLGFGMFVELKNTVEGLVHVSKMKDDHYIFDEKHLAFIGRRTKRRYQIGDQVKVKLVAVDKKEATIDFILLANKRKKHTIKKRDHRSRRG